MENKNLALYEEFRAVPKEAQKSFNNGRFSGTDINPMWRIKKLTEVFGPAGIGWYTDIVERHIETASDGTKCAFVSINMFVKVDGEWSKPIYGEGGNTFETKTKSGLQVSDEAYKMAYTDALSNAAKALGVGADVWFANDKQHGTKYDVQQENYLASQSGKQAVKELKEQVGGKTLVELVAECKTTTEVTKLWNDNKDMQSDKEFRDAVAARGKELKQQEQSKAA